jgi:hypothetical protein
VYPTMSDWRNAIEEIKAYRRFVISNGQAEAYYLKKVKFWDKEKLGLAITNLCQDSTQAFINLPDIEKFYGALVIEERVSESKIAEAERYRLLSLRYQKFIEVCDKQSGGVEAYNPQPCISCASQDNCLLRSKAWIRGLEAVRSGWATSVEVNAFMYADKAKAEKLAAEWARCKKAVKDGGVYDMRDYLRFFPETDTIGDLQKWARQSGVEGYGK